MSGLTSEFDKNNIIFGLVLGLISPAFAFALFSTLSDILTDSLSNANVTYQLRTRTLLLVAICTNILWIRFYNRAFHLKSLRGVVFSTMALSLLWFGLYYSELYAD